MTQASALPPLPALVVGRVGHARTGPIDHAFQNRMYQWLVDLDALPRPRRALRPFAGFRAADHLGDPAGTIKGNVLAFLAQRGIELGPSGRIVMLASARVLGYVFNPLSVHWCFAADGSLRCIVAEVHNTYGDRHAYLLEPDASGAATADKALYVSPFYDVSGAYELRFQLRPERVVTTVALRRPGHEQIVFRASFQGRPRPATTRALLRQLLRHPLMPQRISVTIRLHGIWLWLRRLPIVSRPHHPRQEGV